MNTIERKINYLYQLPSPNPHWTNLSFQFIKKKMKDLAFDINKLEEFVNKKNNQKILDYWLPRIESYRACMGNLGQKFG